MKRAALITGGAKRIGKAIALALAAEGIDIALHYNSSKAEAEATALEIQKLGVKCAMLTCDLSQPENTKKLVEQAFSAFPHLNILINNASVFAKKSFAETDPAFLDQQFAVNFKAPFFLMQAFAEKLKGEGQVVNMLDSYIHRTNGQYFAYLLSKKALAECTRMAARELAPRIRVNGVCVGITTLSDNLKPEYVERMREESPGKALVQPEEVAAAVLGLLQNSQAIGQFSYADAGLHLL